MDCRLLVQSPSGVAAVVDAFLYTAALQASVDGICPRFPLKDKLFVAVPSCRDWVLPTVFRAFGILGCPLITVIFRFGRYHIHFIFSNLVLILLV